MPVRVAIVGCGRITERLALPQLVRCRHAVVTTLVDRDRGAAERVRGLFDIRHATLWTDWRRMLREAEVDAVAVNVPNDLHAEVAIAALRAKKHVIVEKPIARTLAEADAMIAAAQAHHRYLMVEQTQRFDPAHEAAFTLLRRGAIGRVSQVRGRLGHAGPEYWSGAKRSWLTDARRSGGGALIDIGVHIVDLLRWLSGKAVKRMCCQAKTLEKRLSVEDNASALLEFTDGTLGSFEVSWTTRPYEVATSFYGSRGTLRTSVGRHRSVSLQRCVMRGDPNQPAGAAFRPALRASSRWGGAYPYFARCIMTRTAPFISGEEGRATLEIVLAAYESARTGRWVELPLQQQRSARARRGRR